MWEPDKFLVASFGEPYRQAGYVYRGLGIYQALKGSPKGRRPPTWRLVHLGSGHGICYIDGKVAAAFAIAAEIAECGDWSFDGLDGWRNVDPDIREKTLTICKKYPKAINRTVGGRGHDEAQASAIAVARA